MKDIYTVPLLCAQCGHEFVPSHPSQIYCSKRCRMAKYKKLELPKEKLCPLCGITFTPSHGSQIYCSTKCYSAYRTALYLSGDIRPIVMEAIKERDNYKCQDCGIDIPRVGDKNNHGHLHHITPLLTGGSDCPTNIVLLCSKCHSKRHKRIREALTRSNKASNSVYE